VSVFFPVSHSASGEVRVRLEMEKGAACVDLRIFDAVGPGRVMMPTRKGLTFPVSSLPALVEAITKVSALAVEIGWLSKGGER
jgi:hypothetical protein